MTIEAQVPSRRLPALDGLRGLAALAVVLFHYTDRYRDFVPGPPMPFHVPRGDFGVHLFFMISGFVILMSLERSGGMGFVRGRIIRLYPAFWAAVLLTAAVTAIRPVAGVPTLPQVLVNLTMLQDYVGVPQIDGVYWSLTYEIGFYAFMFALFRAGGRAAVPFLPAYLTLGAALFSVAAPYVPHPLHFLLVFNAFAHLFGVGLAMFLIRERGPHCLYWAPILAAPVVQYLYDGLIGAAAVIVCAGLMAWAALGQRSGLLAISLLVRLGTISYALYLTHQMIGYAAMAALEARGASPGAALAVTLTGAVGLAAAVTYGVERPAARWLRRARGRRTRLA